MFFLIKVDWNAIILQLQYWKLFFDWSRVLLAELEAHRDAWPFLTPVNHKAVPGYRKVIKKPMDFSTIKEKLTNNQYVLPLHCILVVCALLNS